MLVVLYQLEYKIMVIAMKIIILSSFFKNDTIRQFYQLGMSPVMSRSIYETLEKLRMEKIDGVLFFCYASYEDPIELILNVRDVDGTVPIFLVGCEKYRTKLDSLTRQPGIYCLGQDEDVVTAVRESVKKEGAFED